MAMPVLCSDASIPVPPVFHHDGGVIHPVQPEIDLMAAHIVQLANVGAGFTMTSRSNLRALAMLTIVVIALVVLASGLSQSQFRPITLGSYQPAGGVGSPLGSPAFGLVRRSVAVIFLLVLGALFVYVLVKSSATRRELAKRVLTAFVLLVLFYALLTLIQHLPKATDEEVSVAPAPTVVATPAAKPPVLAPVIREPPAWFVGVTGGIVIMVILAAMWLVVRQRNTLVEVEQPVEAELVVKEARGALEQLQAGGNVRDVVLRCYLEMSRVLSERRAIRREQAMTPREFEQRLVAAGIRDEHIRRLTQLFERIRYSVKTPDRRDEDEAQACLTAIIAAYGRSA